MPSYQQSKHSLEPPGQSYFDPEGDELKPSSSTESPHVPLTWRGDPNETLSDWTIVVVTSELQTVTYHVHKSILCFGARPSKHFAEIMQTHSADKRKKQNRHVVPSTKVELDQRDADNFPILLDFMYAPCTFASCSGTVATATSTITSPTLMNMSMDDDCSHAVVCDEITTENAVSLRYLAKRFEVDSMVLVVNRFIQKDLNFKTGPIYLSTAAEYKDTRLMESAQRLCAENIEQISSKALLKLPTNLFRIVIKSLESFEQENRELSNYLSEIVCRYLEKHPESRSASLLLELTDPLLMPCIESEAAIGYTALIKELDVDDAKNHWGGLVSLSRRCGKAVVQEYGWNDFSVNAAIEEYLGNIKTESTGGAQIDSLLFATSFAAALDQAQDDYEEILVEQERMEKMLTSLHETVSTLENSNLRKDQYLAKQQWAIEEAKKQIMNLKEQIAEVKKQNVHRTHQRHQSILNDLSKTSPMKELVSPSQIGADLHVKKKKKVKELRTKSEMRSQSLIK